MTRTTNARLAGFMFLFYIACALPQMILFERASRGDSVAARLASIAQHTPLMRWAIVLSLITFVDAFVLAVSLYGLTRDEDNELAVLALCCRIGEGVLGAIPIETLGLLWLATNADPSALDVPSAHALAAYLLKVGPWQTISASLFFAVGSTLFAYLLLRGRMIPAPIAWVGVFGSALLVVILPLQLAGYVTGVIAQVVWIPVALFELTLAPWLLIKGVTAPTRAHST